MWSVVLKILSILGIILLCLLGFLLLVLLLVLFMPAVYRGGGKAHDGEYEAWFRFRWLFGLVRGEFDYPRSKALRVRVLWLTVFESGGRQEEPEEDRKRKTPAEKQPTAEKKEAPAAGIRKAEEKEQEPPTDRKDKLQHYLAVVQDQDNQDLVKHALSRLSRIIKSIRPRMLRAEAVVGLGEPDTTGYLYGAYWAIKPFLGKKCQVSVTPDFERQILEGKVSLRGRIVAAVLLYQAVRVALDKRLWKLLGQLKDNK